jgi:hypothetical protein
MMRMRKWRQWKSQQNDWKQEEAAAKLAPTIGEKVATGIVAFFLTNWEEAAFFVGNSSFQA